MHVSFRITMFAFLDVYLGVALFWHWHSEASESRSAGLSVRHGSLWRAEWWRNVVTSTLYHHTAPDAHVGPATPAPWHTSSRAWASSRGSGPCRLPVRTDSGRNWHGSHWQRPMCHHRKEGAAGFRSCPACCLTLCKVECLPQPWFLYLYHRNSNT